MFVKNNEGINIMKTIKNRLLAATPLISLLGFLVSGLYLKNWSLGWTFFLLIPLSWMLLSGNILKRLNETLPLLCLTVFLILGFGFDLWNPGWVVFLLIPLSNMIINKRFEPRKIVTFIVTLAFITIGLITGDWHPTWIIFLLIPIINTIFFPQRFAYVKFNSESIKNKFRTIIEHEDDDK